MDGSLSFLNKDNFCGGDASDQVMQESKILSSFALHRSNAIL